MFAKPLRAVHGAVPVSALALFLLLPALAPAAAAQRPEPPVPDTAPGPAVIPPAPAAPAAPAYSGGGPAAAVKALELQRFDALVKGDTAILERLLAEDLVYVHSTGVVDTKASFLSSLTSGKLRYLALAPDAVEVRLLGEAGAVVTGRADIKVVANGKEISFPARFTSVYAKHHGRWLLASWQSTVVAK
jgi:uncharacterized protein (TIGR02246 family)